MATTITHFAEAYSKAKIVVIKIGSSMIVNSLADGSPKVDRKWIQNFAKECLNLQSKNKNVIVITSGATAAGRGLYPLNKRLKLNTPEKHAAAAVGQVELTCCYQEEFAKVGLTTAQLLLAIEDTENRKRHTNVRYTLEQLLSKKVVPIINENDSLAKTEYKYGDNDRLAARVGVMISADIIILLTDIDGFYKCDVKEIGKEVTKPEKIIEKIDSEIESYAMGAKSKISSGGMQSKIDAAKLATNNGISLVITHGKKIGDIFSKLCDETVNYSLFVAKQTKSGLKQKWIASSLNPQGCVVVDDGAAKALVSGKSLLFAGITQILGDFAQGDIVEVTNNEKQVLALGVTNYDSVSAKRVMGKHSSEVQKLMGKATHPNLIHRDHISITAKDN